MGARLTHKEIDSFHAKGFHSPLRVFSEQEAHALRAKLERVEQEAGPRADELRIDLHLLYRWAWDVVHDPRVVGPVTDVLGPDVLLWSLNWFIKEPQDGKFVSFHQDATYWGLEPHDVVTAWVALSDSGPDTGPMKFIPGSHRGELCEHNETYSSDNLLTRGQTIEGGFSEEAAVLAPLKLGEMSLHHVRLIHGSEPNRSDDRRIGMVIRYAATRVRQTRVDDTAVLVAGSDEYGHFKLLPPPQVDLGAAECERHRDAVERLYKALMPEGHTAPAQR